MKAPERRLIFILVIAILCALALVSGFLAQEAEAEAQSALLRLEAERAAGKTPKLEELRAELNRRKSAKPEDKDLSKAADPIALGAAVKAALSAVGMKASSYSLSQGRRNYDLEFDISASPDALSALIAAESSPRGLGFSIRRCKISLSPSSAGLSVILGIGTALTPMAEGRQALKPPPLRRLFPAQGLKTSSNKPGAAPQPSAKTSASPRPEAASWLSFVGRAENAEGKESFFFKDSREGRMLELNPVKSGAPISSDALISQGPESLIIRYKGVIYEIKK